MRIPLPNLLTTTSTHEIGHLIVYEAELLTCLPKEGEELYVTVVDPPAAGNYHRFIASSLIQLTSTKSRIVFD